MQLPTNDEAIFALEMSILQHMADHEQFGINSHDGSACTCFGLRSFGMHREVTRGLLRSMRDRALVYHQIGLWSEDGEPAGAGYGLTKAGLDRVRLFREGKCTSATFDPTKEYGGDGSVPF